MGLRIFLTGTLAAECGENAFDESDLGGRQARLAFAFLVLERHRGVPRDELAETLWPGQPPPSWESALRGVVSKVRSALGRVCPAGDDVLTSAFGSYQLRLQADTIVDLEAAGYAVEQAEKALADDDAQAACDHAMAARAVTGRPFLVAETGPWVEKVRDELRERHVRALEALSEARVRKGEAALGVEMAKAAIAAEPLRETAHRCLMRAHAAAGNRGEALRAYERCRRLLAEELGVNPSPETRAVYAEMLGDEPVAAEGSSRPDVPLPAALAQAGTFLGREPELGELHEAWTRAQDGRRQVVLVAGEAGVGKSAVVARFAAEAHADGAVVLFGHCDEQLNFAYQPFTEALGRYVAACPSELLRQHLTWSGPDLSRVVPQLTQRLPELPSPAVMEPETQRFRLFAAVTSFLAQVARSAPVVLVIEDVQWGNEGSLLLLRHLVRALESEPVLLLVTFGDQEMADNRTAARTIAELRREPGVHHMALTGLGPNAVETLVAETSDGAVAAPGGDLARMLWDETDGNPFYVLELLRHLQEASPHRQAGATPADVPENVAGVIRERCARLGEAAYKALAVASVIGRQFDLDVVQAASGLQGDGILDALDEACRSGLIQEVHGAVGRYRFAHALIRSAVYQGVPTTRRARLHAAVGAALERLTADARPGPDELAHHFASAGTAADPAKAAGYAVAAGDEALVRLAYETAADCYQRALELGLGQPGQEVRRCRVLMALASAQRKAGQVALAREGYLQAARLARRLGDPEALAVCALGLAGGGRGVSAWIADEVRISLLEEALASLAEDDTELRAKVLADLSTALYFSDQHQRREALARQAVETARRGRSPSLLAGALGANRATLLGPGNAELRLACSDEVVALAEQAGDDELTLEARLGRLPELFEIGARAVVDTEVDAVLHLAARLGQPYFLWRALTWDGTRALVDGRLADAERRAADALEIWPVEVHHDALPCLQVQLATLSILQGRPEESAAQMSEVAESYPMIPAYRCLLAFLHAAAGQRAEARAEFERFASDGFASPPLDAGWLLGMAALSETCAVLGDADRADVLHDLLVPFSGHMVVLDSFGGGSSFWGSVSHQLGLLDATRGHVDQARRHFQSAQQEQARFGAQPWMARTDRALQGMAATLPS